MTFLPLSEWETVPVKMDASSHSSSAIHAILGSAGQSRQQRTDFPFPLSLLQIGHLTRKTAM